MRRQISWLVLGTTSAVVVSFVIPLCLLVATLAEDRAMAAADQEARRVATLVARLHDDPQLAELVAEMDRRATPSTQVLLADGRQLRPGSDLVGDPDVDRARRGAAFTTSDGEGSRVLLPVVVADGTAVVRTSVTEDDLRRGVPGAWAGIVGLGVLLLVLAFAIASWFGRRISAPVLEVAGTAHRLREGDLSARAEPRGPEETRELASALNRLAERTGELLAHERAAVGDLSHRLRTPVTALRLDAETVPDPELAGRLQQHIAVLQRTIDAIVRDARRPVRRDLPAVSDATAVVADRVAFWQPLADEQQRQMDVVLPGEPLRVRLESDELSDLVDVVADNVFAHTPDGTALRVELRREGDHHLVLLVTDSGPGFPPGGRSERTGSTGLGLDIVRRAVHGAGGTMRLASTPSGGALVEVVLPLERA